MANIEDLLNDIDEVLKISSPKKPCRISNLKHESPKETSVPKSFSVSPEKKVSFSLFEKYHLIMVFLLLL